MLIQIRASIADGPQGKGHMFAFPQTETVWPSIPMTSLAKERRVTAGYDRSGWAGLAPGR